MIERAAVDAIRELHEQLVPIAHHLRHYIAMPGVGTAEHDPLGDGTVSPLIAIMQTNVEINHTFSRIRSDHDIWRRHAAELQTVAGSARLLPFAWLVHKADYTQPLVDTLCGAIVALATGTPSSTDYQVTAHAARRSANWHSTALHSHAQTRDFIIESLGDSLAIV